MKALTSNNYKIMDSFSSTKDVLEFDASFLIACFVIKSLFTNIPLTDTLNQNVYKMFIQNVYKNQTHVSYLTKNSFYNLFKITKFESFFIFVGKFYEKFRWKTL